MIHGMVKGSLLVHYLEPCTARVPVRCSMHLHCYRTLCDLHVENGRTVDDEVNCMPCVMEAQGRTPAVERSAGESLLEAYAPLRDPI